MERSKERRNSGRAIGGRGIMERSGGRARWEDCMRERDEARRGREEMRGGGRWEERNGGGRVGARNRRGSSMCTRERGGKKGRRGGVGKRGKLMSWMREEGEGPRKLLKNHKRLKILLSGGHRDSLLETLWQVTTIVCQGVPK